MESVGEEFAEEALGEGLQGFASLREDEGGGGLGPVELEAGGLGRDPDLTDGGVRGEDELGGALVKEDVEDAVVVFGLEAAFFLGVDEGLLEGFRGRGRTRGGRWLRRSLGLVYGIRLCGR